MSGTAPFHADVADGPDGGQAHWLTTTDGLRIRATHWRPDDAKATVLLFTGRTEFAEKYGRTARAFTDAGYAVAAIDWRGQGLSDRLHDDPGMGHVGSFGDYQKDVAAFTAHVDALDLPEPRFLLAHSLGGGIGLRALMEGLPVRAAAFSAPMFGIAASRVKRLIVMSLAAIARRIGRGGSVLPGYSSKITIAQTPFEDNELTHDPDQYAYMQGQVLAHPELGLGAPSLHWVHEAVSETDRLSRRPAPDVPTLTLLGTEETIVHSGRIHQRMAQWPNGTLQLIEGGRHEMMLETPDIRDRVLRAMIAHFDAHL